MVSFIKLLIIHKKSCYDFNKTITQPEQLRDTFLHRIKRYPLQNDEEYDFKSTLNSCKSQILWIPPTCCEKQTSPPYVYVWINVFIIIIWNLFGI